MHDAYRTLNEDEKIIIDSRLSTLEKEVEKRRMWSRIGVAVIALLAFLWGAFFASVKHENGAGTCVDEIKITGPEYFEVSTPPVLAVQLKCEHPRQRGHVVSNISGKVVTYECVCQ